MADVAPVTLGELLKRYRIAAGFTQEALAERAGLSARAIRALESGARRSPRKDTLALLASALSLTPVERSRLDAAARHIYPPAQPPASRAPTYQRSRPPLVGRQQERALLIQTLHDARFPLVLLAGEPGIGKSRLLEETADWAKELGWTVLTGGCHRRSAQEPYAPCLGALARFIAARSPAQQRLDLQGCAWLARLLPELMQHMLSPSLSWTLPPQQERRLVFAAAARFLANVAGPAGTLLILDDLHWAGADALDLLAYLVREYGGQNLRIVGAYRDTDVAPQDALPLLLGDLARDELVTCVSLAPLANEEAAGLLSTLLTGAPAEGNDLRRSILSYASGIPYYLVSLAQAARSGFLDYSAIKSGVPWSVAQSIRQRVAPLAESARELLAVAAVVARATPRTVLLRIAQELGYSEEETLRALEATTRARLLVERADGSYAFAHDLIRETLDADMSGVRRAALHRRVGAALAGLPQAEQRAAELAWHFAQGDELARALPYTMQAGDHAEAVYAHGEAETHFRAAAELAHTLDDRAHESAALERLADVLYHLARYSDAYVCLERAIVIYQADGNWERLAWATAQLARASDQLSRTAASLARLEELLSMLAAIATGEGREGFGAALRNDWTLLDRADRAATLLTPKTAARISLCLTSRYLFLGRYADVYMPSEHTIAYARKAGDTRIESLANTFRAQAQLAQGQIAGADLSVARSLDCALASGDLESLYMALTSAASMHELQGFPARALDTQTRMLDVAIQLGNVGYVRETLGEMAAFSFILGDWDAARRYLQQGADHSQQQGLTEWSAPEIGMALFDLAQGGDDAPISEALTGAREDAGGHMWVWGTVTLAESQILAGRAATAAAQLRGAIERSEHAFIEQCYLYAPLAWAELTLGDVAQASETIALARSMADAQHNHMASVDIERIGALLALHQGHYEKAQHALEQTLALCLEMPSPYAEIKARYAYGQLHTALDAPGAAREQYEQALTMCERLGEGLFRAHIERALAALPDA